MTLLDFKFQTFTPDSSQIMMLLLQPATRGNKFQLNLNDPAANVFCLTKQKK